MMYSGFNFNASRSFKLIVIIISHNNNLAFSQYRKMAIGMGMTNGFITFWKVHLLCIQAIRKMVNYPQVGIEPTLKFIKNVCY